MKQYLIVGSDTETYHGKPFTVQFSHSKGTSKECFFTDEKKITRVFLKYFEHLLSDVTDNDIICFVHNLEYDIVGFFYQLRSFLLQKKFTFSIGDGWNVEGVFSSVVFARMRYGQRTVHLIDTYAFFKTSLEKLAEIHCPDLPKKEFPQGLGETLFTAENKDFVEYATRDAVIAEYVGAYIIEQHKKYDIDLTVSTPHFASKVFRRKFLKESIPLPPKSAVYSALHSYHGGKNNCTVGMGFYPNVYSLDLVSAYPDAMRKLPSFSRKELYKKIIVNDVSGISQVPEHGIYRISGHTEVCEWPIIYDHNFKPIRGAVEKIWTTGPELNEALRAGELKLTELEGIYYDSDLDTTESPFVEYVDEFFTLKDNAKTKAERDFAKLLLNSLYGKFIQTTRDVENADILSADVDNVVAKRTGERTAGGLFNPFIATLITGYTRANIHFYEHKYKALHTATDGIFSFKRPLKDNLELGGLKTEFKGDLLLFRNKLYIFYVSRKDVLPHQRAVKSAVFKDKMIVKYALHGFHGKLYDLEKMYVTGRRDYTYTHVNKLRESSKRGLEVNKFEKRTSTLNLNEE